MMTLQQIARALGGEACGNQVRAPGPGHSPKDRSLSIKLDASAPDGFLVHSFADDDPIRCKDYVREKLGLPPWNGNAKGAPKGKTIVATYDYTNEAGELLFQVVRYTPKGFRQRRPDGNGGWIWSLGRRVASFIASLKLSRPSPWSGRSSSPKARRRSMRWLDWECPRPALPVARESGVTTIRSISPTPML